MGDTGVIEVRFDGGTTDQMTQLIPVDWTTRQLSVPVPGARVQCRYEKVRKTGNTVSNTTANALVLSSPDVKGYCRVMFDDCGTKQKIPCEWIHKFVAAPGRPCIRSCSTVVTIKHS